jgi:hypothetical protein
VIIKIFLIASVVAAMLYLLRGGGDGRRLAIRRLAGVAFGLGWVVAVISPDLVTRVANVMGVGRGTDLVLYVLAVAFLFTTVAQRQQVRELEERVAVLAREVALTTSALGSVSPHHSEPAAGPSKLTVPVGAPDE